MADAPTLKNARATAKSQFTRAEKKVLDAIAPTENKIPITTIQRRFADVTEKWTKTQDAHDAYVAVLAADAQDTETNWIDEVSDRFDKLEVSVDKYIENEEKAAAPKAAVPTPPAQPIQQNKANNVAHRMKFDIDFPKFNGDIRKYPEFKETFINHVQPEFQPNMPLH